MKKMNISKEALGLKGLWIDEFKDVYEIKAGEFVKDMPEKILAYLAQCLIDDPHRLYLMKNMTGNYLVFIQAGDLDYAKTHLEEKLAITTMYSTEEIKVSEIELIEECLPLVFALDRIDEYQKVSEAKPEPIKDLIDDFQTDEYPGQTELKRPLRKVVLENGVKGEIHITLTIDEDEFLFHED